MSYLPSFLILLTLQFFAFTSFACQPEPPPQFPELFQKANSVFIAHVYRTEEKPWPAGIDKFQDFILEGDVRVIETFKGNPPADGKVKTIFWNCRGTLVAGLDYVFFIRDDQKIVSWEDGSRALPSLNSTATKTFLETLRKLAEVKSQP